LQTKNSSLLLRIQELEEKLLETQLQLERVTDEKLTRMLSIQKSPTDKTGLGYVAPPTDTPSTSKTVFVKPAVPEPPPIAEDKGKDKINDDVPCTQKSHSIRRSLICHHCGLSVHVRPQCSLLKAQKAKAKKEVPRQANHGTRPLTQHQTPWYQAPYQAPWRQYYSEPPIWMQSMMEWMGQQMKSCQQPPTGRQAWVKKKNNPMRGNGPT
jgi:hypothetical protein